MPRLMQNGITFEWHTLARGRRGGMWESGESGNKMCWAMQDVLKAWSSCGLLSFRRREKWGKSGQKNHPTWPTDRLHRQTQCGTPSKPSIFRFQTFLWHMWYDPPSRPARPTDSTDRPNVGPLRNQIFFGFKPSYDICDMIRQADPTDRPIGQTDPKN